jgi:hypothetical protein
VSENSIISLSSTTVLELQYSGKIAEHIPLLLSLDIVCGMKTGGEPCVPSLLENIFF